MTEIEYKSVRVNYPQLQLPEWEVLWRMTKDALDHVDPEELPVWAASALLSGDFMRHHHMGKPSSWSPSLGPWLFQFLRRKELNQKTERTVKHSYE